jgi:Fe-S cluster assembly protein SufB
MKTEFLNSLEFEAFCQCADLDIQRIKVTDDRLINGEQVDFDQVKQILKIDLYEVKINLQTWRDSLVKLIETTKIDEKKYQLTLARLKLDPELIRTFDKLGIGLVEQDRLMAKEGLIAMDYVIDSTSVYTSFQEELSRLGIIFCPISEAVINHPDLVRKYLGSVVPFSDNFFASLNSAVFSDGSFCYIPPNVRCPMELSTYFRINASGTGQFERTLIIADKGSYVSYLEGCTAPARSENQLHSAVVELIALDDAKINYSTVQNWYSGDQNGVGGVYNFVTKRGICLGCNSSISWTQVEAGSAITWKYPSVILKGDGSSGEFYSVAVTDNYQQADTGSKMIHIGANTRSKIISKGISKGNSVNSYRGKVQIASSANNAKNYTKCDSMFLDTIKLIQPEEIEDLLQSLE